MRILYVLPLLLIALPASAQRAAPPDSAFFGPLNEFEGGFLRRLQVEPFSADQPLPTHEEALAAAVAALKGSAVPESFITAAFADPAVKVEADILERFKKPGESLPYEEYRKIFITPERIAAGRAFYLAQKPLLLQVQGRTGLDPLVLVALVGVETYFGRGTGKFSVFNALYTIERGLASRSKWAARELAEYLKIAAREGVGTQSVKGSYAGAFGYYQFIPSSYNARAIDFDGDGKSRWDQWPDVFGSIANYLSKGGYQPGPQEGPGSPVWKALYSYNHSDSYVKVILELKSEIAQVPPK